MVRVIRCLLEAMLAALEAYERARHRRTVRRLSRDWGRQEVIDRVLLHAYECRARAGEHVPEA